MAYTQLSLSATPGMRYSFIAKLPFGYVLYNFIADSRTFNFSAKNKAFNFNAKSNTFNFTAKIGTGE